MSPDRPTAPRLPATDAGTTAGNRYEAPGPADVLRRIPDLLIGDLIAFEGRVREVARVRLNPQKPGEVWLGLVDDPIDETSGHPIVRRYVAEARVRVLRSSWEAPRFELDPDAR
jgi:hypothetical protein